MTSSVDRYEDEGTICRAPTLAGAPSSFRRFCLCRSEGGAFRWPRLAGAVDLQMVQRDVLRPQRFELDFGVMALGHLPPAIDVRFTLDVFAALERPQELPGVIERCVLFGLWPRHGLHYVTAKQFRPVAVKQRRRGEDVAPGHLTAVSHHHANHALALQGASKPPLHLLGERLHARANRRRLVESGVRFGPRFPGDCSVEVLHGDLRRRRSPCRTSTLQSPGKRGPNRTPDSTRRRRLARAWSRSPRRCSGGLLAP